MMLDLQGQLEVKWNLEILGFDRGKKQVLHQRTHNIVLNNGRQFILENLSASAFPGTGFTRVQDSVVRYMGIGIGGNRQTHPEAAQQLAAAYPGGYGGTNAQTDSDVTVSRLERPVLCSPGGLWLKQVGSPAQYPMANAVKWSVWFDIEEINLPPYAMMPISEIGLFTSRADPLQPNGGGTYPGNAQHMIAYDNFFSLPKTGFWSMAINWTWTI